MKKGVLPPSVKPLLALGPLRRPPKLEKGFYASVKDVAEAAAKAYSDIAACGAIPAEISLSDRRVGPLSFLRAMAQAYRQLLDGSTESVEIRAMNEEPAIPGIDFASRVAGNWKWVIFPEGFSSQRILEHTLLQLWTLKPAVMKF